MTQLSDLLPRFKKIIMFLYNLVARRAGMLRAASTGSIIVDDSAHDQDGRDQVREKKIKLHPSALHAFNRLVPILLVCLFAILLRRSRSRLGHDEEPATPTRNPLKRKRSSTKQRHYYSRKKPYAIVETEDCRLIDYSGGGDSSQQAVRPLDGDDVYLRYVSTLHKAGKFKDWDWEWPSSSDCSDSDSDEEAPQTRSLCEERHLNGARPRIVMSLSCKAGDLEYTSSEDQYTSSSDDSPTDVSGPVKPERLRSSAVPVNTGKIATPSTAGGSVKVRPLRP